MKEFIIKNAKVISPADGYFDKILDIVVRDGKIAAIGENLEEEGLEIYDARGQWVSPGFIDIHVHCFPFAVLGIEPDMLGLERGATTVLDAGTSGCNNYEDCFENYIKTAKTKIFTLINVSKEGLKELHELNDMNKIDEDTLLHCIAKHRKNIVGIKARASGSVVGQMGLKPIVKAKEIADKAQLPLVVHVGNYPPALGEVLDILGENDVVTHAFHGKNGGILDEHGKVIKEALVARQRGVKFDIGHGAASFSFVVFQKALKEGFDTDLISTDLHKENYLGPVYNIMNVITKMVNCGESFENAITKVTSAPADHFKLDHLGHIRVGDIADLSIFELVDCNEVAQDSMGQDIEIKSKMKLNRVFYSQGEETDYVQYP